MRRERRRGRWGRRRGWRRGMRTRGERWRRGGRDASGGGSGRERELVGDRKGEQWHGRRCVVREVEWGTAVSRALAGRVRVRARRQCAEADIVADSAEARQRRRSGQLGSSGEWTVRGCGACRRQLQQVIEELSCCCCCCYAGGAAAAAESPVRAVARTRFRCAAAAALAQLLTQHAS